MAVMTYAALAVPPCCQACWNQARDAQVRRNVADGAVEP